MSIHFASISFTLKQRKKEITGRTNRIQPCKHAQQPAVPYTNSTSKVVFRVHKCVLIVSELVSKRCLQVQRVKCTLTWPKDD